MGTVIGVGFRTNGDGHPTCPLSVSGNRRNVWFLVATGRNILWHCVIFPDSIDDRADRRMLAWIFNYALYALHAL